MNNYLAMFAAIAVFTSSAAFADDDFDPKRCYKRCMSETKDKEVCNYICNEGPEPDASKMRKSGDEQPVEAKKPPTDKK
ncbi:MAG: hypothetical protein V4484_06400 [Pseudomonadota bacterium]